MARPKKADDQRRDRTRLVRLTESEDLALVQRAKLAGMNASEFLRNASLKRHFTPRQQLAEIEFILYLRGEIGRTGDNLNQLIQQINMVDFKIMASAAQAVINQLQEINGEVLRLLRHGYSGEEQG